jgi:hypothetical protein
MGKEPAAVLRMLSPLAPPLTALKAPGLQSEGERHMAHGESVKAPSSNQNSLIKDEAHRAIFACFKVLT